jgi:hypothetical protein
MQRTPMKRTAWPRRLPPTLKQVSESESKPVPHGVDCAQTAIKKIVKSTAVMAKISDLPHTPIPKTELHRSRALLDMARGRPCLLRVAGVCSGRAESTVACHSNKAAHGKGGARKADDEYSVWGCFSCHGWLDQGKAPGHTKDMVFMRAHADQVLEWRRIAQDPSEKASNRLAAQWALDQLNATPVNISSKNSL